MKKTTAMVSLFAASAIATGAMAAVPDAQISRLGADLTPVGAEKAGSGDIPAWTGGLPAVPSSVSYTPGDKLPNPFASDSVKFTITGANMAQYDQYLTDGYRSLLSTYPSYKMDVYPTRRSCAFPDSVYAATRSNAGIGTLVGGGNGVGKAIMGFPFPIPNNALEIIWNHTLRFRSFKLTRQFAAAAVTRSGDYTIQTVQDEAILRWSDPSKTAAEELNNISLYYIANTVAPARSAGNVILVHETLDRSIDPRKAWSYSPGTRRVRRAPNIAYDNPGTNSDGLSTSDSFDGYNGAPDRYNWTVIGKEVKAIAFNNYDAESTSYANFITPLHINQDVVRYELARTWRVEATLKAGNRHVYGRRVKTINEDNWSISSSDMYDARGELWRVQELQQLQRYQVPLCGTAAEVVYDLQAGRYLALAMTNEEPQNNYFADELNEDRYTPASIRQMGTR
ncbi:MAG: DUF1329 domain-containing protein [Parvibaculaceae bacterium]|jgi:hypothetical protein|nr:DUF1329 domain-containing protein [Parvibaculaceae bacterium]|tara:strand:- start:2930 stop:4285 length:1356 start_codon:yes stop_codon:yes gene_type:complete